MLTDAAAVLEAEPDTDPADTKPKRKRLPVVTSGPMPRTVADCPEDTASQPCPYPCRHSLAIIDGRDRPGRRHGNVPPPSVRTKLASGQESCALRVVEAHPEGMTPDQIGAAIGCTGERVNQLLDCAFAKLEALATVEGMLPPGVTVSARPRSIGAALEFTVRVSGKQWRQDGGHKRRPVAQPKPERTGGGQG